MGKIIFLQVLWVFFVLQLASAAYVSDCSNSKNCATVKVIAQDEHDIAEALQYHASAQSVDLHGNLIESLPRTGFNSMTQLKTLNLSYNYIKEIQLPNNRIQQLQVVDITYNNLERVAIPASVETFVAVRNKLYTVEIHGNNRLKRLILSKNKFDSLRAFGNLGQIVDLDLSCNQIKEVDLNILSRMSQILSLNLANNHIHSVSGSGSVNSLQTLDLSNNILTMVDESFNNFPAVSQLYLRDNKIVMWLHEKITMRQLKNLEIRQNDWDCKNLKETYSKFPRSLKTDRDNQCETTQKLENGICCTTSDSPYADRLIKYRKQEYDALKAGTAQLHGEVNCSHYVPNPCDGDDNLVHKVASSALLNAESLAQASVQQLQISLKKEQQALSSLQTQHAAFKAQNEEISRTQQDLAAFIDEAYKKAGLTAPVGDEVAKLDALFASYDANISALKAEINKQDRLNQDKLDEINTVNGEMDELNLRKNSLQEEVNKRNGTVIEYKRKIAELEQKIKARDQRT